MAKNVSADGRRCPRRSGGPRTAPSAASARRCALLPADEDDAEDQEDDEEADGDGEPQPSLGALDDGVEQGDRATIESRRADRVEAPLAGIRRGRHQDGAGDQGHDHDRHVDRKTEPHQKCSSRKPLSTGPMAAPAPEKPAQMAMARARSLRREHVGEDRQGGRHDERRPDAHDDAGGDEVPRLGGEDREQRGEAEDREAELQHALATEAVTEGARREQQAGEDDGVGVDDPLELGAGGVEVRGRWRAGPRSGPSCRPRR